MSTAPRAQPTGCPSGWHPSPAMSGKGRLLLPAWTPSGPAHTRACGWPASAGPHTHMHTHMHTHRHAGPKAVNEGRCASVRRRPAHVPLRTLGLLHRSDWERRHRRWIIVHPPRVCLDPFGQKILVFPFPSIPLPSSLHPVLPSSTPTYPPSHPPSHQPSHPPFPPSSRGNGRGGEGGGDLHRSYCKPIF